MGAVIMCAVVVGWFAVTLTVSVSDLEMAVAYWNLILTGRFKFLDLWNTFLLVRHCVTQLYSVRMTEETQAHITVSFHPFTC